MMTTLLRKAGGILMVAAILLSGSSAWAEVIGLTTKVIDVNASDNFIKIDRLNSSGETEEIKIEIERGTLFKIYTSLYDVKAGDDIVVEADFNEFTHRWKAMSIAPSGETAKKIIQEKAKETVEPESPILPHNEIVS